LIIVSAISGRLEKSSALIFLSYIFLFWFCQQENVREENADLRISQIIHFGRNDDQSLRNWGEQGARPLYLQAMALKKGEWRGEMALK
jgi:hypothetical protein